jgi:hypothetical protein
MPATVPTATRQAKTWAMSEGDLQRRIIDLAHVRRWRVVHIRPLWQREGKMVTAYEGDKGLPDLILARGGRVILAELKREKGAYPTPDQQLWLRAAGPNGYLWRPSMWAEIVKVLM